MKRVLITIILISVNLCSSYCFGMQKTGLSTIQVQREQRRRLMDLLRVKANQLNDPVLMSKIDPNWRQNIPREEKPGIELMNRAYELYRSVNRMTLCDVENARTLFKKNQEMHALVAAIDELIQKSEQKKQEPAKKQEQQPVEHSDSDSDDLLIDDSDSE